MSHPLPSPVPVARFAIAPRDATRLLGGTLATLVAIPILLGIVRLATGRDNLLGLVPMFDVTLETNVPTWFSGGLLVMASMLLMLIARNGQLGRPALLAGSRPVQWYGLALIFAYLSLDEIAQLHERTTAPVRSLLGTEGVLYWAWVIPAMLVAVAIGALYSRFVMRLPPRTARWFVIAAVVYVGSATGGDILGGAIRMAQVEAGTERFLHWLVSLVEETGEMGAIVLFIHVLLRHVADAAFSSAPSAEPVKAPATRVRAELPAPELVGSVHE